MSTALNSPASSPTWSRVLILLLLAVGSGGLVGLAWAFRELPDVRSAREFVPSQTTTIYDINGQLLDSRHGEANRQVVPLSKISPNLRRAILAMEDSSFYGHWGLNPGGILRALVANLSAGGVVEGGSTLTMQLAKNLYLSPERSFGRKLAETVLALRLEQVLSKDELLQLYLNQIYWGHNLYGAETAARSYFNKSAADLTLGEAALLAGLVQAPEDFNPFNKNYELSPQRLKLAKERQSIVLGRMQQLGWITAADAEAARQQPLKWGNITSFQRSTAPWVTEAVIEELSERFGRSAILQGGLRVQTTIDNRLQKLAQKVLTEGQARTQSQGLGAEQMALVAIDPRTHFVKALAGGVNYPKSQYNRAIAARRQPGSAFKPFVYYAALASGKWTPSSTIVDAPVTYRLGWEVYSPRNADGSYSGAMSLQRALEWSRNIPAIKLGQSVGLDRVIELTRLMGVTSPLKPVVSLPLGAVGVTPLELTNAYATLASGGWQDRATLILRVTDSQGRLLLDHRAEPQLVLDPNAAAGVTQMLKGVIDRGTGTGAQIGRPAAGKTGTTSDARDIWFVGYVPQLATAIWAGNDDNRPLYSGASGGGWIAPLWRQFMTEALKDVPAKAFPAYDPKLRPKPPVDPTGLSSAPGSDASDQSSSGV
jgi:penicillin-binding protein 1A